MEDRNGDIFQKLQAVVRCARTGSYSDAASSLNESLVCLQPVLTSGRIPEERLRKLTYSLETVYLMQKQEDWVAVADVIEFEFIQLLRESLI
jgi:hypothetical protein